MRIVLVLVFTGAILAVAAYQAVNGVRVRPLDDSVVRSGSSIITKCETMDGGAATDCLTVFDGGQRTVTTDYILENSSATCVRVGSDSSVDNKHGIRVGSGCPGGTTYTAHAAQCFCESEGARLMVDVNRGHP